VNNAWHTPFNVFIDAAETSSKELAGPVQLTLSIQQKYQMPST
jgi:hypothetical protein